jgi:hypothetical protein
MVAVNFYSLPLLLGKRVVKQKKIRARHFLSLLAAAESNVRARPMCCAVCVYEHAIFADKYANEE